MKLLDSLKSGKVLLIPNKLYINKMQTNKEKKYTQKNSKKQKTQKTISIEFTTVIKSVLVTNTSCRFYDRTND